MPAKYGGALGTATQSADDYYGSAQMKRPSTARTGFLLRQKPNPSGRCFRPQGPAVDGRAEEAAVELAANEAGVFSGGRSSLPRGRRRGANILDPATHLPSNKLEDNAPIDEPARPGWSIDEAIGELLLRRGMRYEDHRSPMAAHGPVTPVRGGCRALTGPTTPLGNAAGLVIGVVDVAEVPRQGSRVPPRSSPRRVRRKTARRRSASWPSPSARRSPPMSCRGVIAR